MEHLHVNCLPVLALLDLPNSSNFLCAFLRRKSNLKTGVYCEWIAAHLSFGPLYGLTLLMPSLNVSPTLARRSYVMEHLEDLIRCQLACHLTYTAYLQLERSWKSHPCYHDGQPFYPRVERGV